jgi:N12 class adenine-specific DNA methylase
MTAAAARQVAMLLGSVGSDGSYSDAITGRGSRAENASLATIATEMAQREGGFTVADLWRATGKGDIQAVKDELFADPAFSLIPDLDDHWTTRDQYLSGHMWPSYDAALAASQNADLPAAERARFARQAEDLLAAIGPKDLGDVENIEVGSPFVTKECLSAWLTATRSYGPWTVEDDRGVFSVSGRDRYGASPNDNLLERVLMRRGVRKDEATDVDRLQVSFREWLMSDEDWRAQTEERYNRDFRGYAPRTYSRDAMAVPGLNPNFSVNDYQWSGVRWALDRGRGIIAADVGVGKTPRALILNQLLRSTGQAKKPVIVMPKSLIANWGSMQRIMFPGARVLTIGETLVEQKDGTVTSRADDETTRRTMGRTSARSATAITYPLE